MGFGFMMTFIIIAVASGIVLTPLPPTQGYIWNIYISYTLSMSL